MCVYVCVYIYIYIYIHTLNIAGVLLEFNFHKRVKKKKKFFFFLNTFLNYNTVESSEAFSLKCFSAEAIIHFN